MPHNIIRDLLPFRSHREWKLIYDALDSIHNALAILEGNALSDADPAETALIASPGISTDVSRADHVHPIHFNLPFFDVKDFGAVGDGVANDTATIQAAIDALPAQGGIIFFPPGVYLVTSAISVNRSDVWLRGAGFNSTIVRTESVTADVFAVGDGLTQRDNLFITDLQLDASVTKTAGAGVLFNACTFARVENVKMLGQFYGIRITGGGVVFFLNNLDIRNTVASDGVGILIEGGNDHFLSNIIMDKPSGTQPRAGIEITESGGTWITNVDAIRSGTGLLVNPGAGQVVRWLFVMNSAFDTCSDNGIAVLASTSTSTIMGLNFTGNWTSSCTNHGIAANKHASAVIDGILISDHRSFFNGQNGILLNGGINVEINDCLISGNSATTSGDDQGIAIGADVSGWSVRGCRVGQTSGFSNTQGYGVVVNAGASDNYQIIGNDLRGNISGAILDGGTGTNKQVFGNIPMEANNFFNLGNGAGLKRHLSNKAELTYAEIPANGAAAQNITVTGAVVGDSVVVTPDANPGQFTWYGRVVSANTVEVILSNFTAGALTPAVVTWRATVWQY